MHFVFGGRILIYFSAENAIKMSLLFVSDSISCFPINDNNIHNMLTNGLRSGFCTQSV